MKPEIAAPDPWGRGDLYTILVAVIVFAVFCTVHKKAIISKGSDSTEVLISIFTDSAQIGPFLMVLLDPFVKIFLPKIDLLGIVLGEARIVLWIAAFMATIRAFMSLIKAKD